MIEIHQDPVPLKVWEDGSIRIHGSRMQLYLVIEAWQSGASPEYISNQMYPSLSLADTHAVIAYYLRHKEELAEYFRKQDEEAEKVMQAYKNSPAYQAQRRKLLEFKAEWERRHEEARQ
jgi:uncharacterized protein (DUF433 family)